MVNEMCSGTIDFITKVKTWCSVAVIKCVEQVVMTLDVDMADDSIPNDVNDD